MAEKRQYKHPQFNLRIPEELKAKIEDSANTFKRSMNAQIVAVLEEYYETSDNLRDCITITFSNETFNESEQVRHAFSALMKAVGEHSRSSDIEDEESTKKPT